MVACFYSGALTASRHNMAKLMLAAGVDVTDMRHAVERWEQKRWRPPSRTITAVEDSPSLQPYERRNGQVHKPAHTKTAAEVKPSNRARFLAKNPGPDMRVCSRCDQTKPTAAFDYRSLVTRELKSACRECLTVWTPCARCGTMLKCTCVESEERDNA